MKDKPERRQHWTAERKLAVVLSVLGKKTGKREACRKHRIIASELNGWIAAFIAGGRARLGLQESELTATSPAQIARMRAMIGELVLERDLLRKKLAQQSIVRQPDYSSTPFRDLSRAHKHEAARDALQRCGSVRSAAQYLGVSHQTVYNYLADDKDRKEKRRSRPPVQKG